VTVVVVVVVRVKAFDAARKRWTNQVAVRPAVWMTVYVAAVPMQSAGGARASHQRNRSGRSLGATQAADGPSRSTKGGFPRENGLILVPVHVYFKNGRAKVELARGKESRDKRHEIAKLQADLQMERAR
jgi:hypothetical protein